VQGSNPGVSHPRKRLFPSLIHSDSFFKRIFKNFEYLIQNSNRYIQKPMAQSLGDQCFEQYLKSVIQKPHMFTFLHQTVTRCSQLENAPQYLCSFNPNDNALHVRSDAARVSLPAGGAEKVAEAPREKIFPIASFERIEFATVSKDTVNFRFVTVVLKDDRSPLVLFGPTETLELWFDGLRFAQGRNTVETESAKAKQRLFKRAGTLAGRTRATLVEDPPLPPDFEFSAEIPPE
jgi:hypothetical protein